MIDLFFPKDPQMYTIIGFPFGQRYGGYGLVTDLDKTRWKHRRGIFNPAFHKQVLISFMDEFNLKSNLLLEKLRLLADGKKEIKLLNEFHHVTLDVIATVRYNIIFLNRGCIILHHEEL